MKRDWFTTACDAVAAAAGLPPGTSLFDGRRYRVAVQRRRVLFKLLREDGASLPTIAHLSGFDHTTVQYHLRQFGRWPGDGVLYAEARLRLSEDRAA